MPDLSLSDLDAYQAKDPQSALDAALSTVRGYCGWHVAPSATDTVKVWSLAGSSVWLPTRGLTAVTSVTQNAAVVDPATYTFESNGVISRTYGAYFSTLTPITVVFTHGYTEWPDDAKNVVLALAQRSISDTRGMVPGSGTGGGSGASTVVVEQYGAQLTDADKDKLAPFAVPPPLGA